MSNDPQDVARNAQRAFVLYVPALIVFCVVAWQGTIMVDGDTYLHVAAGQWIIQHRQLLYVDPFTFTYGGTPWSAPEWLSELLSAVMFRLGGWSGVALLYAASVGLVALLLARQLLRQLQPLPASIALFLTLACVATSLSARPYLLGLPLLVAWTDGLLLAREQRRAPWLGLLPLMTLWSNVHGSFLLGLALIGVFAAEASVEEKEDRLRVARDWLLFGTASLAAAAINPHGIYGIIAPLQFTMKPSLNHVVEWQSTFFSEIGAFEILILAILFVAMSLRIRVPLLRLLLLLLLLHMALAHRRHINVFAVIAPMILAEPIGRALAERTEASAAGSWRIPSAATFAALAMCLMISVTRLAIPDPRVDSKLSPLVALSHVPAAVARLPVLNSDAVGGFLIWHGVRPFIDTRSELFSDAFLQHYYDIIQPKKDVIVRTLEKYQIAWTILSPSSAANAALDTLPGWRVLYADKFAIIHVRTTAIDPSK